MYIDREYRPRRRRRGLFARLWPLWTLIALGIIFYETQPEWLVPATFAPTPTPTRSAVSFLTDAQAAETAGRYDEAIAAYKEMARLEPTNPEPLIKLSDIYLFTFGNTDTSEAFNFAKRALDLAPKNPRALNVYARVLDWQFQYDDAASYALDSLEIDPQNADTLGILGEIYNDAGRPDLAQDYVDQALAIDPQNVLALRTQAYLYERSQDYTQAVAWFDKAIAAAPHRFDLYIEKAREMRYGLNDFTTSLTVLEQAAKIYTSTITLAALGEGQNLVGDHFQAVRTLRDAVEIEPNYAPAQIQLGMALYARRNYEDAAVALETGINLLGDPNKARIENVYSLGLSYVYKDPQECDKAIPWLKKAIDIELAETGQLAGPAIQGIRDCRMEYLGSGEIVPRQ